MRACALVMHTEPAVLRRNIAYSEFLNNIKFRVKYITIQLWPQGRSEVRCIHELMFQAGVKGMSGQRKLIPCNYY